MRTNAQGMRRCASLRRGADARAKETHRARALPRRGRVNARVPRRSDEGTTRGERKARLQDDARALEAEGAHERGEKHGRGLPRGPGALERVAEDGATRKAEHGLADARKNDARHGRNVEITSDKGQR